MVPRFFDASDAELRSRRNLPHIRQADAVYFVTYRTADSLPAEVVARWKAELAICHDKTDSLELARRVERHIDRPQGRCLLAEPAVCDIVTSNLLHGDGSRYMLDSYVVMPNHVHLLIMPLPGHELTAIIADAKRYTARQINQRYGLQGQFWADEMFDHIVRSKQHLARFREYIALNPRKVRGTHTAAGRGSLARRAGL